MDIRLRNDWFYLEEGLPKGPFEEYQMLALGKEGTLMPDAMVFKAGTSSNWIELKQSSLWEKLNNPSAKEAGRMQKKSRFLFSEVFHRHSLSEAELLLISGTKVTTPPIEGLSATWPKPWLFSRVLLVILFTFFFLLTGAVLFGNVNMIPGLIMMGSAAIPISLVMFFWEMNAPRNISMMQVLIMLFVGGVISLITALCLYTVFPIHQLTASSAVIVGIIEEAAKFIVVFYLIKKLRSAYILNGMLVGSAIGAGFSIFESAGYAFSEGLQYGEGVMFAVIMERGLLSIGTHVVWAAILGAGIVYVKNNGLSSFHFLRFFGFTVFLHAMWDSPFSEQLPYLLKFFVLIGFAWIVLFWLISKGLQEIAAKEEGTI